ncbi:MAG: neutral/alkaline non-lysosomal ceramidase N-terminal domain-containing protein [Planctomycetaceae bacterium]|nr:neutral/alkaline non-lysosomal ceramidase N-terminal domain-containing protein [Planctomycetaceae bacterium]
MTHSPSRRRFLGQSLSAVGLAAASLSGGLGGLFSLAPSTAAADSGKATGWKAGVAKAVITPEKAVWLAGYGSKRPPDGKIHDLWMKALALEDDKGNKAVLITSDFQGVPKIMSDPVFEQVKAKFGLERKQIMFTFSHNHCGPRLGDDLIDYYPVEEDQEKLVEEYTQEMIVKAVAMVGDALSKLAPANLAQGQGKTTFAVNRRDNREADVPKLIEEGKLVGVTDHSVPVLTVTRPDGKLEAVLFGYACHPTTLSFLTWCGDYPGFAQVEIEKNHPGTTAMFVNTCGGDQNPLPRRKVELCEKYGHMLATAVEEALKKPLQPISVGLKTAFAIVDLPYLHTVTREELVEVAKGPEGIRPRWARRLIKKLDAGGKFETAYPYPVHAWRLGKEMLVIGQGAETVVDYALRFKSEFGPGTWVMGYADDMISYSPSKRVWLEGGYEGGSNLFEYGRPAYRWHESVEELIAKTVHQLVKEVSE